MTKPTTTDGKARKVLRMVRTIDLPEKRDTPKYAPKAMPMVQPMKQAVALTPNDLPAMVHRPGSSEVMS
jgi:hypothetical protein